MNYDNKIFITISNTENGEVNEETIFHYHQKEACIWAEYGGGMILKGFLVGLANPDGALEFHYLHLNKSHEIRTGKCRSTPQILEDGRIELLEKWEWTNGDKSRGESKIIEKIA